MGLEDAWGEIWWSGYSSSAERSNGSDEVFQPYRRDDGYPREANGTLLVILWIMFVPTMYF